MNLGPPDPPFDAERVYEAVWRCDFTAPGFVRLDAGAVDSHTLRAWMVGLKERLVGVNVRRTGRAFVFRSLGRFDQPETTKFHLDGAPDQSVLMLGYEPSEVRSRPFLADYARTNALGVRHKAEVVNPTEAARRVVNSALLVLGETDEIGPTRQHEFVTTDRLSPKVYG